MSLSDFLSSPNLFFLGIVVAIIGGISMFFMRRLSDQHHKIVSMMGLVSTMAEELNFIKRNPQLSLPTPNSQENCNPVKYYTSNSLIEVSDESDTDSASSDSDSDSDSDSESDSENESEEVDKNVIKIVNMSDIDNNNNINFENVQIIESESINSYSSSSENNDLDDILEESLDELNNVQELSKQEEIHEFDDINDSSTSSKPFDFMKTINISCLEDDDNKNDINSSSTDYKKMPLNKLKSIVIERKLINDPSKMKKPDLLKLLESSSSLSLDKNSTLLFEECN